MRGAKVSWLLYFAIYVLEHVHCRNFGYNGAMGPEHWGEQYSQCGGKHQSPININLFNVATKTYPFFNRTNFKKAPRKAELQNNGHTVLLHLEYEDGESPTMSGGPLKGDFVFTQLHFHWGDNDTIGSEDRINNQSFPAELHVVFSNLKYGTFEEAVLESNGVAVLAFFFEVQPRDNPDYVEFSNLLEHVIKPDTAVKFEKPPALSSIIAKTSTYYTYIGSLTTPPCSEDVTWIDYTEPITISPKQLEKFRQLHTDDDKPLTHNFRPVQPLNDRTVYTSIPTFADSSEETMGSIPFVNNLVGGAAALKPIALALILTLFCSCRFNLIFEDVHVF